MRKESWSQYIGPEEVCVSLTHGIGYKLAPIITASPAITLMKHSNASSNVFRIHGISDPILATWKKLCQEWRDQEYQKESRKTEQLLVMVSSSSLCVYSTCYRGWRVHSKKKSGTHWGFQVLSLNDTVTRPLTNKSSLSFSFPHGCFVGRDGRGTSR